MRGHSLILLLLAVSSLQAAPSVKRPVDFVDPRIDTYQTRWIFFASASRPFGMVALSPDTRLEGDWGAGYIYVEPYIRAFSHIHDWQLAGVPVMPVVGRMNGHEGYEAYKAPFSHDTETVRAGYHKVVLDNSGITAELTSTTRIGFHRYSLPATQDAYVLLDVGAPIAMTQMADASIRRTGPRQLSGYSKMAPTQRREKPCTVFFVVDFDQDVAEFGGWEKTAAGKAVRTGVERVAGATRCRRPSRARHLQQRFVLGLAVEPERALVVRVSAHDERADLVAGGLLRQRRHDGARPGRRQLLVRDDRRPGHAVDRGGVQQGHPRFRRPGRLCGRAQERLSRRHPGPRRL